MPEPQHTAVVKTDARNPILCLFVAPLKNLAATLVLMRRNTVRAAGLALTAAAAVFAISGCGQGAVAFDGGHVPVGGGSSRINGVAFLAANPSMVVPNATVTVTDISFIGPARTQATVTAADGSFSFASVPDAAGVDQIQISVTPPAGSLLLPQRVSFTVNAGSPVVADIALPSVSFVELAVGSVTISPPTSEMHSGDTVKITPQLLDTSGNPLPEMPSLVFVGNFGVLEPDGLFTSTGTGTGSITAYWYTGSTILSSSSTTVIADTSTVQQPPPPPVAAPVARGPAAL